MKQKNPTYLLIRNGIYYFQLRIPKHIKNDYDGRTFIRCSLKTSCRLQALNKARTLWVEIMSKKKISMDEMDNQLNKQAEQYRRGKILSDKYQAIDPNDDISIDEFFIHEFGKAGFTEDFDKEAFTLYQEKHLKREPVDNIKPDKYKDKKRLSDLVAEFIVDKDRGESWSKKTKKDYVGVLNSIIELYENPYVKDLTRELITEKFSDNIRKFPTNSSKIRNYLNSDGSRKNIHECIQIAEEKNLKIVSYRTQKKYITQFNAFLIWAEKRRYVDKTALVALDFFKSIKKPTKQLLRHYTKSELEAIFYNDIFISGKYHHGIYVHRHWGGLLALYTGARANEIAQIQVNDIKQADNIYYIDISDLNDDDEHTSKRLKTTNSRRIIPLHNDLITLGFLDYVQHQKSIKQKQLFSKIRPDKDDTYHRKITDWYRNKFLKKLKNEKLVEKHKNFHSFRHTVMNEEKQKHLNENIMREIVGHGKSSDVHSNYQGNYHLRVLQDEINKLNFGLDLSKIRVWTKK